MKVWDEQLSKRGALRVVKRYKRSSMSRCLDVSMRLFVVGRDEGSLTYG